MKLSIAAKVNLSFALGIAFLLLISVVASRSITRLVDSANGVALTQEVRAKLGLVLSLMDDVETGTRGYLITGADRYLEPYQAALPKVLQEITALRALAADNASQQHRLDAMQPLVERKLAISAEQISVRKARGFEAGRALVLTDTGKHAMDEIRGVVREMLEEEDSLLKLRAASEARRARLSTGIVAFGDVLSLVITGIALFMINRNIAAQIKADAEKTALIAQLQEALANVKTLSGLLPICSHCKKIRDDKGYWNQIETYVRGHSDAEFSHGICPECLKQHHPEIYEELTREGKI